jgi:hypothetical protein
MSLENLKNYDDGFKICMAVRIGEWKGYKNGVTAEEIQQILKKMGTELTVEEICKTQKDYIMLEDRARYLCNDKFVKTLEINPASRDGIDAMLINCGLLEAPKLKIDV